MQVMPDLPDELGAPFRIQPPAEKAGAVTGAAQGGTAAPEQPQPPLLYWPQSRRADWQLGERHLGDLFRLLQFSLQVMPMDLQFPEAGQFRGRQQRGVELRQRGGGGSQLVKFL